MREEQRELLRPDRELLRPAEVASQLGLTTGRIYQLCHESKLPHVKIGRTVAIPRKAWADWLAEQDALARQVTAHRETVGGVEQNAASGADNGI